MNKNESLSQDRSFSFYPTIHTSSSNINIQFIPSIQGSSPQIYKLVPSKLHREPSLR